MAAISMERKVLGVFVLMFAGLLATTVLAFITTRRLMNTAGWVSHTYAVMDRLQATRAAALQAESAMRGFVITGDNNFLNTKDSALSHLATDYIQLRNMTGDNPVEQRHLDKLSRTLGDWRTRVADVQLARQFTGFTAAQALVRERHIATSTAQIFLTLDAMHAEEQRLLDARLAEERHRDTVVNVVYVLLCSLALLFFIGMYLQIRREILQRRQTEEKFRGLFDSAPDAIVVSDAEGHIVLVNAQTEKSFGYARQELIGQSIDTLVPERFHDRYRRHRADYIAAPRTRMMDIGLELFARRKDGSEFPADISLSPISTSDGMLVFSEIRDITWRKQAEQELRANETRFRAVADTANDAVISADSHGNILYFNPAAERIFGYAAREVLGKPITLLMPGRFHHAHEEGFRRFLATGEARVVGKTVELTGKRKQGSEFPLELSLASWRVEGEVFLTGIVRDMTLRRESERQIRELNEHLEQRAVELETVNQELEAFSYSVSHDLRAPLRAVDGFSRLLEQEYRTRLDAEGLRLLTVVRDNSRKMGALIDDLLTFSRLGRKPVQGAAFDTRGVVEEALSEVLAGTETPRPEVDIASLPNAWGDRALLKQVWLNLLANAVKYSSKAPQPRISVGGRIDGDECVYHVQDNGVGFDMRYSDKLFGVFQRLHGPEQFPGTGVGLAIVKRVVVKHGGRVWAESKLGEGANFFFSLPNKDPPT